MQAWQPLAEADRDEEDEEAEAEFGRERMEHEWRMLRNPVTGRIPANIRAIELAAVANLPLRKNAWNDGLSGTAGTMGALNNNNYTSIGPNNVAGRTRTLAWDARNPAILLTGGVTGGIFRSTDAGANWTFVSPEDNIRSVTSIVQDPTAPDTWYCGTGEVFYLASQAATAPTFGYGIYKSTNNGVSWTKLANTETGSEHRFDNNFDLVHRMAVHPTTGHVYAAVHNRIVRSTDKGASWTTVLGGTVDNNVMGGLTEVYIPPNGARIFAGFSGGSVDNGVPNRDRALAGVWQSTTGAQGSFTRIAGGTRGSADSVAGWRPFGQWGRIVLTTNAATSQLYVLYKNGEDATFGRPEADLFRADLTAALPTVAAWTNLNAWVPDEPNFDEQGIDPYTTQFEGYNMSIRVKPDNDNILFIGGTNLHRVALTETNPARKFRRVGGYAGGFFLAEQTAARYPNHHPDVHAIYYLPGSNSTLYTASDGGIHKSSTPDMADTVRWTPLNNNLQTLQYQSINIVPDPEFDWVIGGAQDNGTHYNLNITGTREHTRIGSGDGGTAAMGAFEKNANSWKQSWYYSIAQGNIYRLALDWRLESNRLSPRGSSQQEITPNGRQYEGQWLTLFVLDPDSTKHLYYTSDNRLYRTTDAAQVTSDTWTEMTGVRSLLAGNAELTAAALSKLPGRDTSLGKRLFLGTNGGKLYRLDNANTAGPQARPVDITPSAMLSKSYVAGIAVNPRNPDTVLVVVSNYDDASNTVHNIFWSGNATTSSPTWQAIDGALEPVSVQSCAIVVKTSGVEYYVGTSVGLYSTTALAGEGTSWLNEGDGMLKRAIVRSLAVRHEDNTLVVGTHGNGAFYTQVGNPIAYGNKPVPVPEEPLGSFISAVRPTLTRGAVSYFVGTAAAQRISVQVFNSLGQLLYREERAYADASLDFSRYASGVYFLRIISADGSQKLVRKIVKL